MKLARFCQLAYFIVFVAVGSAYGQPCQPPNFCGQLGVWAGGEFNATSSSAEGTPTSFITNIDNDKIPFQLENGVLLAEYTNAVAQAETSRANAIALGDVVSRIGDLSLNGKATVLTGNVFLEHGATVNGRRRMGIRGGNGSAEAFLSAGVTDFVSVNTFSVPVGKRLLVRAQLKITGGFTGNTSYHAFETINLLPVDGGPLVTPPDAGASVIGSASMAASKGAFFSEPYDIASLGPTTEVASFSRSYGLNSHGTVTETIVPPPRNIAWNFIAPNRQAEAMGYSFQLEMRASAEAPTTAGIYGDFHGSIHWGGIVSVENADTGEVITDWTITSASGFDYSKPFTPEVPEPSSLVLLSAVLCLWPVRARIRVPAPPCL